MDGAKIGLRKKTLASLQSTRPSLVSDYIQGVEKIRFNFAERFVITCVRKRLHVDNFS